MHVWLKEKNCPCIRVYPALLPYPCPGKSLDFPLLSTLMMMVFKAERVKIATTRTQDLAEAPL